MSKNPFKNMPKEKQISALKKALKNPKTPAAFRPSLKKRLQKLEK